MATTRCRSRRASPPTQACPRSPMRIRGPARVALPSSFVFPTSDTDLVTHSYNGFPAKNPEEFQQFFLTVAGSKSGVPSPTPIEAFQETYPATKTFLTTRDPPPVSYATTSYFSVKQLQVCQRKGAVTIGRYQLLPDAGQHFLSKDESAKAATDYLEDEIRQPLPVERSDSRWCCSSQRRATRSTIRLGKHQ
jgi:hypothetical protein